MAGYNFWLFRIPRGLPFLPLAKVPGEPLLFKGQDFSKTDIEAAV